MKRKFQSFGISVFFVIRNNNYIWIELYNALQKLPPMKSLILTYFLFTACLIKAQDCDYTQNCLQSIDFNNFEQEYIKKTYSKINKECFLDIMDSIQPSNITRDLFFLSHYYFNMEIPPYIEDVIDSTVAANISYHIADSDLVVANHYRNYFSNINKQYLWIIEHNEKSRSVLRKYILSQKEEIDLKWVDAACQIGDSIAFSHALDIAKNNEKSRNFKYIVEMGIKYFNSYELFEENLERLMLIDDFGNFISNMVIDYMPTHLNKDLGKRFYDKVILNKSFMTRNSVAGSLAPRTASEDSNISIFNYKFMRGIEIFYPELMTSSEYRNSCKNKYCFFDQELYNLLVKTIRFRKTMN